MADESLLLRRREDGPAAATALELFFDLVYVFAITQLAAVLVGDLTVVGVGRVLLMLVTVWWAWNYTTWMTNWFDPDALPVRIVLVVVMLLSLTMSVGLPEAFGPRPLLFAASYVALQVIRNAFNVWAVERGPRHDSFRRILWWSMFSGAFWIAGAFVPVEDHQRAMVWIVALIIDLSGPYARYWTPGLGASGYTDWDIDGHHFAERFQLLVIIALGESIVVIGASVSGVGVTTQTVLALIIGFLITVSMWSLYFDVTAAAAQHRLANADDRGQLARDGYTYLHLPIVAGIIADAVALKLVIKHPADVLTTPELLVTMAGPILYLTGHNLFRLRMTGSYSRPRLVATVVLVVLGFAGLWLTAIQLAASVAVVLMVLASWETRAIRRWYRALPHHRRPEHLAHLAKSVRE